MTPDWLKKWDPKIKDMARESAIRHQIDPNWVWSIVQVESGGNPILMRYEKNWRYLCKPEFYAGRLNVTLETEVQLQMFSYGLMQIMGSVCREYGYADSLALLIDPFRSLEFGCRHLASMKKRFSSGRDWIAAYNGGSPRKTPDGKYEKVLEEYVNKVVKNWNDLNDL
jgi:soluble lytic murein transglycosylase-like protein